MECGQSNMVPAQNSGLTIVTWVMLFLLAISCGRPSQDVRDMDKPDPDLYPEIPYSVTKHKVNHDSLPVIPAKTIGKKAGKSNVEPYKGIRTRELRASQTVELDPTMIKVLTPGKDSLPLPRRYILAEATTKSIPEQYADKEFMVQHGEKIFAPVIVSVKHPEPKKILPLRKRENAGSDIQYLAMEQGLFSSGVGSLFEDSMGNLWFGQGVGVGMYDGSFLSIYGEKEGHGKGVGPFYEDSKGRLWMGNWVGMVRYDGKSFTHYFGNELGGGISVMSMAEDKTGAMWFGTPQGLIHYHGDTLRFYTEREGLINNVVHAVEIDHHGNIWAGTGKGITKFDGCSFTQFHGCDAFSLSVFDLIEDSKQNIWMGTPNGAYKMGSKTISRYDASSGLSGKWFWCVMEDSEGNIWLGGPGANKISGNRVTRYRAQDGLIANGVRSIIEDRNHHIWLGTGGGLVRIRDHSFANLAQLGEIGTGDVSSIFENEEGKICFTILGSGLYLFDGEKFESLTRSEGINANTRSAFEDEKGHIWMSTFAGLQQYDGDSILQYLPDDGDTLIRNIVKCIYLDSRKQMWLGYWNGGLMKFDGQSFTSFHGLWYEKSPQGTFSDRNFTEQLVSIQEDSKGQLWYATAAQGLFKYDGEHLFRFTSGPGINFHGISAAIIDRNDHIWLGTNRGGVLKFNGDSFIQISEEEGLGSRSVSSLVEDKLGNIWAGTQNGLYQISTQEKDQYPISFFGRDHGLKEYGFSQNAACLDRRNRLWWGTGTKVSMLDLNTYDFSKEKAVVHLKNLQINEEHISYETSTKKADGISFSSISPFYNYPEDLELSHRLNNLTFTYSAIYMSQRQQLEYLYLLEGLDDHWSRPTRENSVNYRNLPSGKYIFKVKAVVAGHISSEVFEYPFTIRRPWWASWYSYVTYVLILLLVVRSFIRFIVNRERLKSDYRIKQVDIEKMQELDRLKSSFFESVSHEFRTPLTLLLGPVNELLSRKSRFKEEDRKLLGIMKRNTRRLHQLINQLLDISRLESGKMKVVAFKGDLTVYVRTISNLFLSLAESKGILYQIDLEESHSYCIFDRDKTEKIITNLLSNAFKYTLRGGTVVLRLDYILSEKEDISSVRIRVEDSGRGIPEEHIGKIFDRFHQVESSDTRKDASMGIGLALTHELVTLLNGFIEVESTVGEGSVFSVVLPVTQGDYANCEWESGEELSEDLLLEEVIPIHLEIQSEQGQIIPSEPKDGRPEVLLVEDNQDLRQFISQKLITQYFIIEAVNGQEGMQMALDRIPDIIISDLIMPVMGGEKMCGILKADPRTSHIPIIMLTAKADKGSKLAGLETGADDYIIKPFDTEELQARINNLIKLRERLREKFQKESMLKSKEFLRASPQDQLMEKIIEILEQQYSNSEFQINQLAQELNMSRAQVFRKVQALTGFTPNELLRKIRLKKAADLFDHGHDNVSQVMYQIGFNNQSHFTKIFREVYQMSPSAYVKASRAKEGAI